MSMMAAWMASAFWLGLLTSISPCPLATNIAAVSFLAKDVGATRRVLLRGLAYSMGRALAYTALGVILSASLISAPLLSHWLQLQGNRILGPILIFVALVLLEVIPLRLNGLSHFGERVANWQRKYPGIVSAFLLGALFALSFCPVSAALFFGSLLPLALKGESPALLPFIYGIGTGLPVMIFAVLITFGSTKIGKLFEHITAMEKWGRRITAVIFLIVGIYYMAVYLFHVEF